MGRHLKRFHPAIWRSIFDQPEENKDDEEEEENGTDINQIRRMRFKYKVFIEYQKDFNHPNAIKS